MMIDEDPTPEDLQRFSGETGFCPDCGEEVWDQAGQCPSCGTFLAGQTATRRQGKGPFRRRWIAVVAVIVLVAFAMAILGRW
jgi:hypothetical protein